MPMEVEYFDMDGEVVDVETTAADMVNGRGEESQEESRPEKSPTLDDNEAVDHFTGDKEFASAEDFTTVNQGGDTPKIDPDYKPRVDWAARFDAEFAHEKEIAAAKEEHTKASLARAAAEEVFKAAKAEEKATLAALSALIARGPDYPDTKPVNINQGGGDTSSAIDQAVRGPSPTLDDPSADQSWRSIPIAPMLDGIKGMGDKKREAILSLTPTLGDFEDLRGKAGVAHKQLYEVMPKGVGRAMADELEERALSAMRKHQLEIEKNKPEPEQAATDQPGDGEPDSEFVESPS